MRTRPSSTMTAYIMSGSSAGGSSASPVARSNRERCSAQVIEPAGQEALVELEVLVAADPLVGADLAFGVHDEHLVRAVDPAHLHRAVRDLGEVHQVDAPHAAEADPAPESVPLAAAPWDDAAHFVLEQPAQPILGLRERDAGHDRLEEPEHDELARLLGRDAAALEVEELGLVDRARRTRSARRGGSPAGRSRGSGWRRRGPAGTGSSRTRRGSCPCRRRACRSR